MGVFSAIIALIKAIPIVDAWFQALVTLYVNSAIDRMSDENRAALKKAINDKDQRDLEKAIGNKNAGEPSGIGVIRHDLPGVH